jgi:ABC-type Zn uptake system ZnuABC Zn-binding protein ZnuA
MRRSTAGGVGVLAAVMLAGGWVGCARSPEVWDRRGGPPRVVVTIAPLDNFVRNVGGDHVGVVTLCTTTGPHHYENNVQDAQMLRGADLFFAVGLGLDDKFADPMQVESHNARLRYVKLGELLPEKLLIKEEHEEGEEKHEAHGHAGHEGHSHGEHDPHVWLGIPQAIKMVELIRDELKRVDAGNGGDYDKNAADYIAKLEKLQAHGKKKLEGKKDRKVIAFHESLRYFGKSFDLDIADSIERAPGQEPTPGHLKELVEKCKKEKVHIIAVEPQYPKGTSAEVLQKELKKNNVEADLVAVDPLETADSRELKADGKELNDKEWYEKKMRKNLDDLAAKLK